ncbi:phosphatidylserine/phosphatidylglycerophosphate/cardiolipin synthase family protein [Streptomyces albogriseolus]|uniref:phosphatidylserine/phosphatidylglycerophosphate/ cardiolipin synthase family protein n=1 Tax=Streptomyces albogriseolus TaxID=1887 RepID=UPI0037ADC65A
MRRRIRLAGSLAVPALLGLSLLAPTTAQAADVTSGDYKAVFNYTKPGSTTLDHSILNDLAGLIDRAAPGSTVYMGMYWFGLAELKAKMLDAQDRGVTLRMVSEKRNEPSSTPFTAAELKNGSTWTWCANSCLGNGPDDVNAINHDKYFVFTALDDGRKNVVWQSSQNIAVSQSGELNNALVVSGNATLAARYIAHFQDQVKHAGDSLHTTYDHTTSDPDAPVEAFFFPRDTSSDASHYGNADIVASFIDDVDCARNGRIRISSAELDERSSRPAIYTALAARKAAGCAIEINGRDLSDPNGDGDNAGVNELTGLDIPVYANRPGGCRYSAVTCNRGTTHSKYLLTEWQKADGTQVRHVFTGSHNWTKGALQRNDETLLRIDDPGIYQAYVDNFNAVRQGTYDIDATVYGSTAQHYSRVNTKAEGDQHHSAVASGGTASATWTAVVYEEGDRHDSSDSELGTDVYLRMYKDGVPLWSEKKLSTSGTNATWSHQKPDVGVDANGNAVVVWTADEDGNKYGDIAVRKVAPDGTVTTLPRPHASGDGDQLRPTVAVAPDGSYAVAWESTADGSTLNQVYAASWSGTGALRYQDVQVSTINSGAAGSNRRPDVAVDDSGRATVVWEEDADGNGGLNIGLATLNTSGGFAVARKVANTLTDGGQTRPAVAVTGDGRIVAAWADEYTTGSGTVVRRERVYHRTFSASGAPGGAEARTTPDSAQVPGDRPIGPQTDPDVAVSDAGDFVVAWKEAFVDGLDDVWARGYNADGSTTGRLPALRMNVVSGGGQGGPAVTLAPNGRLSLTYADDYDGNKFNEMRLRDAFANR